MNLDSQLFVKIEKIAIHPCRVCPKAYTSLEDLNKHVTRHDPANVDLSNLKLLKHMISACVLLDRSKSFQCEQCDKGFQYCREYKLHKLTHIHQAVNACLKSSKAHNSNDGRFLKLYKCTECDLRFVVRSTLTAHSVVHEPFAHVCHCGIGYYTKTDLNSHKKLVHPNYIEPEIKVEKREVIKTKLGKFKVKAKFKDREKPKRAKRINIQQDDVLIERTDQNKFICPICKKVLCSKSGVWIHMRSHTGEKPYSCEQCGKGFSQSGALKVHVKRHAGIKEFKCKYCKKEFYDKGALDLHLRTHTKEKPYKCKYCEKPFGDPSALGRHHRIHTGYKPYECPLCHNKYSDASALIAHKLRHLNHRPEECIICHKKFTNKNNLRIHIKVNHTNIKDHKCLECDRTFALKSYLKVHIDLHHTPKKYTCCNCKESLDNKSALVQHCSRVHNCMHCKAGFPSNSHVITHIYVPGGRFECAECGTDFARKEYLQQHVIRRHSTVCCKICTKRFSSNTELTKHKAKGCLRCKICRLTFAQTYNWVQHHKSKHNCVQSSKIKKICPEKLSVNFVCDYCGHAYSKKNALMQHIQNKHMMVLYCNMCPESFYSDEKFQRHKLKGCSQLKCEICGKTFLNIKKYESHVLEIHAVVKQEP